MVIWKQSRPLTVFGPKSSQVIPDLNELKTKMITDIKEHLTEHEDEHI